MKKVKMSVLNSILAGILICGMLAACGAAEKNFAAPEKLLSDKDPGVPTYVATKDTDSEEPAAENEEANAEASEESSEEKTGISGVAKDLIAVAEENLGVKYASNKCSPEDGFDSSGFAYYCLKECGIEFPRRIKDQINAGEHVDYQDLKAGDIAFFSAEEGGKANFCGIYAGGGLIIYAPAPGGAVKTANITTNYWTTHFVEGRRVIDCAD